MIKDEAGARRVEVGCDFWRWQRDYLQQGVGLAMIGLRVDG